jgi:hypothetical protein
LAPTVSYQVHDLASVRRCHRELPGVDELDLGAAWATPPGGAYDPGSNRVQRFQEL